MVTTIQVGNQTLELLKRLKDELKTQSYEEAITQMILSRNKNDSLGGFLGKRLGKLSKKEVMRGLRDKNDRI
jgi:hypothetical protein